MLYTPTARVSAIVFIVGCSIEQCDSIDGVYNVMALNVQCDIHVQKKYFNFKKKN